MNVLLSRSVLFMASAFSWHRSIDQWSWWKRFSSPSYSDFAIHLISLHVLDCERIWKLAFVIVAIYREPLRGSTLFWTVWLTSPWILWRKRKLCTDGWDEYPRSWRHQVKPAWKVTPLWWRNSQWWGATHSYHAKDVTVSFAQRASFIVQCSCRVDFLIHVGL